MRPPLLIRLSNALDALRGKSPSRASSDYSINLTADTAELEAALKRITVKAKVATKALEELSSPRFDKFWLGVDPASPGADRSVEYPKGDFEIRSEMTEADRSELRAMGLVFSDEVEQATVDYPGEPSPHVPSQG